MLKKIIVFIAATFAGIALFAAPVSQEAALGYAKSYFGTSSATLVWNGEDAATRSSEAPAFYVFNNPAGGWVIISGDDTVQPVLGYSRTGAFRSTGMPSNLKWWMERTAGNVRKARTAGKTPVAVKTAWANVGVRTKATGGKLLQTANWSQEAPYNAECPMDGSSRSLTGCVATAMAIVMRHNQWPTGGKGTAPSYLDEWRDETVEARSVEHTYAWNNMPLTDGSLSSSGWTNSQKNAVAQLMRDCGQIVQMWYGSDGSGAMSSDITPAMAKYMSYKATAQELFRYDYKPSVWLEMIKAEIDGNHPLIYGGSSVAGGHQFVCDGYDAAGNVHINWGWGGDDNGYYPICYVGDQSDVEWLFNIDDSAIFGLVPAKSETGTATPVLELEADSGYQGVSLHSGTIAKNSPFMINVGCISNYNDVAYNGAVRAALVDKDGNLKEFIAEEVPFTLSAFSYDDFDWSSSMEQYDCKITVDIALTDAIDIFYKQADGSWNRIGSTRFYGDYDYEGYYTGDRLHMYTVCPMGVLDMPMIYTKASYSAGDNLYFELAYGQRHPSSVAWYFDGAAQSKDYVKLVSGKHTVKAAIKYDDGSSDTVTATISVK